jgi:hypothetical protein
LLHADPQLAESTRRTIGADQALTGVGVTHDLTVRKPRVFGVAFLSVAIESQQGTQDGQNNNGSWSDSCFSDHRFSPLVVASDAVKSK